jgi:hypothetical protein
MGADDHLYAPFRLAGDGDRACRLLRLREQKVQHQHLELGMKVRFGFLDQKEREVGFARFRKLDNNGRHIKEIGVPETGRSDFLWRQPDIGQPETKITRHVR